MNAGNDAGFLQPTDELAEVARTTGRRVTYLQHTEAGTVVQTGVASWTIAWIAPDSGTVVFHVAGNAANGDDSPLGDYVYTAEARTAPAP